MPKQKRTYIPYKEPEVGGYSHSNGFVFSDKIEDHRWGRHSEAKKRKAEFVKRNRA